ncbi:response regulator transcription factor [Oryzihumus sp.]|uniref:response regulator transcription factor n=1 Tax=Oryzihumus sp. TaxID=1968903 RepID=UPI002EDA1D90
MNGTDPTVLVVEDDDELGGLLERLLRSEGYAVQRARDGQSGLHALLTSEFDVAILDRGLPDGDGLDILERLRRVGNRTPVLVLTAYGTVQDRVAGLDAGAEDYVVKPVEAEELFARLRALRRRHQEAAELIPLGQGWLDVEGCAARRPDGTVVSLSRTERDLLAALASRPTRVFSREELRERAFAEAESAGAVDTYVYYLRKKLGTAVVRTVRAVGYRAGEIE